MLGCHSGHRCRDAHGGQLPGKKVGRTSGSSSACPGTCCSPQQQFPPCYLLPDTHRLVSARVMPEALLTTSVVSLHLHESMSKPEVCRCPSDLFLGVREDFREIKPISALCSVSRFRALALRLSHPQSLSWTPAQLHVVRVV